MEITIEKYNNILTMLNSSDEDNKKLALSIIDELDFKVNSAKILLLKKHSEANDNLWKEQAPTVYKRLTAIRDLDLSKPLTYKQVLSAITNLKVSSSELEFYMNDFSNYLLTQLKFMGYDYLESLQLTLKYKDNGESNQFSESV